MTPQKPKALRAKELAEAEIDLKLLVARRLLTLAGRLKRQEYKAELSAVVALLMGVRE